MNLFAYGTLMDPEIMARVSGIECMSAKATLHGYVRKKVRKEVYPAVTAAAGESVKGVLYFDLPSEAFSRLDRFEGPLYVRNAVFAVPDGERTERTAAQTYVIVPEHLDRLSDEDWSFEAFLKTGKGEFQRSYEGYGKLKILR